VATTVEADKTIRQTYLSALCTASLRPRSLSPDFRAQQFDWKSLLESGSRPKVWTNTVDVISQAWPRQAWPVGDPRPAFSCPVPLCAPMNDTVPGSHGVASQLAPAGGQEVTTEGCEPAAVGQMNEHRPERQQRAWPRSTPGHQPSTCAAQRQAALGCTRLHLGRPLSPSLSLVWACPTTESVGGRERACARESMWGRESYIARGTAPQPTRTGQRQHRAAGRTRVLFRREGRVREPRVRQRQQPRAYQHTCDQHGGQPGRNELTSTTIGSANWGRTE
jgi:hypothetical protein